MLRLNKKKKIENILHGLIQKEKQENKEKIPVSPFTIAID